MSDTAPEPDWILEVRQWLQDRDNSHAAQSAADNAALRERVKVLEDALADLLSLYDQRIPLRERPTTWEAARAAEEAKAEADRLAEYNSEPARALRLRELRDSRLAASDKYLLADYPISPEELVTIKAYRHLLRDLPAQEGAPFDGGGSSTPWPAIPQI